MRYKVAIRVPSKEKDRGILLYYCRFKCIIETEREITFSAEDLKFLLEQGYNKLVKADVFDWEVSIRDVLLENFKILNNYEKMGRKFI